MWGRWDSTTILLMRKGKLRESPVLAQTHRAGRRQKWSARPRRTECQAVTTGTTDLRGPADSLVDTGDDNSDHGVVISCVPGTILRASHAFVPFTLYDIYSSRCKCRKVTHRETKEQKLQGRHSKPHVVETPNAHQALSCSPSRHVGGGGVLRL